MQLTDLPFFRLDCVSAFLSAKLLHTHTPNGPSVDFHLLPSPFFRPTPHPSIPPFPLASPLDEAVTPLTLNAQNRDACKRAMVNNIHLSGRRDSLRPLFLATPGLRIEDRQGLQGWPSTRLSLFAPLSYHTWVLLTSLSNREKTRPKGDRDWSREQELSFSPRLPSDVAAKFSAQVKTRPSVCPQAASTTIEPED